MRYIGIYALIMLFISGCAAAYKHTPGIGVFLKTKPHVYKITFPNNVKSGGTGFAINHNGQHYILTNRHVCEVQQEGMVLVAQGRYKQLHRVLAIDAAYDLCVIEGVENDEGLKIANKVTFQEPVYLVGHPRLQPITLRDGFIEEFSPQTVSYCRGYNPHILPTMDLSDILDLFKDCIITAPSYVATIESQPGNSGSPVLNASGDVIGVLYAGNGTGISILVPLSAIQHFLQLF